MLKHFHSQRGRAKAISFAARIVRAAKSSSMGETPYPEPPVRLIEKTPEHLALYERLFRTGDLPEDRFIALRDAIERCAWCRVPPPKWIADAVTQLCYKQIEADRRPGRLGSYRARLRQHRVHLVRWATVRHLRDNCRHRARTWHDAYAEASRELRQTIARGSAESIAASYKSFSRAGFLQVAKKNDARGLAEYARAYSEARDDLLNVK